LPRFASWRRRFFEIYGSLGAEQPTCPLSPRTFRESIENTARANPR
jgi:hypothetical protein